MTILVYLKYTSALVIIIVRNDCYFSPSDHVTAQSVIIIKKGKKRYLSV